MARLAAGARNPELLMGVDFTENDLRQALSSSYGRHMGSQVPGLLQQVARLRPRCHNGTSIIWGQFPAERSCLNSTLRYRNPPFQQDLLLRAQQLSATEHSCGRFFLLVAPRWFKANFEADFCFFTNCAAVADLRLTLSRMTLRGMVGDGAQRKERVRQRMRWRARLANDGYD